MFCVRQMGMRLYLYSHKLLLNLKQEIKERPFKLFHFCSGGKEAISAVTLGTEYFFIRLKRITHTIVGFCLLLSISCHGGRAVKKNTSNWTLETTPLVLGKSITIIHLIFEEEATQSRADAAAVFIT